MNKKVLFIVYYLDPAISVGAHRISYWANNLSRLAPGISVEVITAVKNKIDLPGVNKIHVVPNNNGKSIPGIADEGYGWKLRLWKFICEMDFKFDWVIISGGPFMHFGITNKLKEEYNAKVLLDFRDPFARNPRFDNSFLKIAVKSYFEKKFIKSADKVTSVNEYCVNLLHYSCIPKDKYSVIENGYDDLALAKVTTRERNKDGVQIVYNGTFFDDRNPNNLLELLVDEKHGSQFSLLHIGNTSVFMQAFLKRDNIEEAGIMKYSDMLEAVAKANIGLILTSGNAFESTTKIFDYIGLDLAILIVTEGVPRTGNLHKITEEYPRVYWSENNKTALEAVLNEIRNDDLQVSFPKKVEYSRQIGLKKLIQFINS